jgi:guanylate cyclase soluble subunit beta
MYTFTAYQNCSNTLKIHELTNTEIHYLFQVYKANLKGPSFRCEASDDETITLHYFSERSGLWPIVKGMRFIFNKKPNFLGIVKEVGKKLYGIDVSMNVVGRTQRSVQMGDTERIEEHVIFLIKVSFSTVGSQSNIHFLAGSTVRYFGSRL